MKVGLYRSIKTRDLVYGTEVQRSRIVALKQRDVVEMSKKCLEKDKTSRLQTLAFAMHLSP